MKNKEPQYKFLCETAFANGYKAEILIGPLSFLNKITYMLRVTETSTGVSKTVSDVTEDEMIDKYGFKPLNVKDNALKQSDILDIHRKLFVDRKIEVISQLKKFAKNRAEAALNYESGKLTYTDYSHFIASLSKKEKLLLDSISIESQKTVLDAILFQTKEQDIKNKYNLRTKISILKTAIIAIAIVISVGIFGYAYYNSNRYEIVKEGKFVIDKYDGTKKKVQ